MPWKKSNTAAAKDEPKNASQKVKTILGLVLCVILLPILVINVTLIIKSYTHSDEVPSVGGVFPLIVLTDSMYPTIEHGDLIICRTIAADEVNVGDIICFFDPAGKGTTTVTHRVIEITETEEGELAFRTKGDHNDAADQSPVPASKLVGIYKSRLPGFGNAAMWMQTTTGLIVCVVLPALVLVAIDLLRTRRYEKTHKEDTDELMRELEELRARQAAMAAPAAEAVKAPTEGKEPEPDPPGEEPEEAPTEEKAEEAPAEEETKKVLPEEDAPAEESGNEAPEEFAETPDESDADTGEEIGEIGDGEIGEGGGGAGEGGGGDV